jgi:hypothetical protein
MGLKSLQPRGNGWVVAEPFYTRIIIHEERRPTRYRVVVLTRDENGRDIVYCSTRR